MNNFNKKPLSMSKFLLLISEKNNDLADSIFLFLLKNLKENQLFYKMIERIL